MSAPVVVTGATGLIGRHLVARLLETGHRVRVVVRAPERLGALLGRVDVAAAGLREDSLVGAFRGAATVFHLAACARAWCRDVGEFHEVNVLAVDRLLHAARIAGVPRVVHVSTVLTLPGCRPRPRHAIPYVESKRLGEALVDAYVRGGGDAVVVHPSRVYGPGPLNDANGVTRLIAQSLRAPLVFRLDDGGVQANYVHAADVAEGLRLAAARGARGAHYVLGGENCPLEALLDLVGRLSGIRPRVVALPRTVALAVAHASVLWGRLGGAALITPAWVRSYCEDQQVDVGPTCEALGYRPRPLAQGLEETIRWLHPGLCAAG